MNKYRYLEMLKENIRKELSEEEMNSVMEYYSEYFADAGIEKEAEVIEELGAPGELAKKIIFEYKGKISSEQDFQIDHRKKLSVGWIIFIAIIGSPLWIALFGVLIGIVATIFSLVISFGAIAVFGIVFCVVSIVGGVILLFTTPGTGLFVVGASFVIGAIGIGFLLLTILIVESMIRLFKFGIGKSKNRRAIS